MQWADRGMRSEVMGVLARARRALPGRTAEGGCPHMVSSDSCV